MQSTGNEMYSNRIYFIIITFTNKLCKLNSNNTKFLKVTPTTQAQVPNQNQIHWGLKQILRRNYMDMYAAVVTFVAGSLEAGGLPGSLEIPEVLK